MKRPETALLDERAVIRRVPVARGEDRKARFGEDADGFVQRRDHGIAFGDGERAAGEEVFLHVDDQQCVAPAG